MGKVGNWKFVYRRRFGVDFFLVFIFVVLGLLVWKYVEEGISFILGVRFIFF